MATKPNGQKPKNYLALRGDLRKRLEREGRLAAFLAEKVRYKKTYHFADPVNWVACALKFPPLDPNEPPEFTHEDFTARMAQVRSEASTVIHLGPDGKPLTPEQLLAAQLEVTRAANGKNAAVSQREQDWEILRRKVVDRERSKAYKKPTVAECTLWAVEWAGTPPNEIKPSQVPGRMALRMLKETTDGGAYMDFARIVANKYASKDDDVSEQGIRDDNRKKLAIMERLENYDTEVLDDIELAEVIEAEERAAAAPPLVDLEEEFGEDTPVPIDPVDDYGAGDESEEDDPLDDIAEGGVTDVEEIGGDDADLG